jgi:hypothetical protein
VVEHKETTLGTFRDTEGAFDRTLFEAIPKAAERHGAEVHYSQVGLHYSVKQKHGNYTIQKTLKGSIVKQCPQRGVLSP